MIPEKPSAIELSEWKYPQPPLVAEGMLSVSKNPEHKIHWEEYGNPDGEPVMFVHGGPGGACSPSLARFFDPARYRIILFDQRGCGKSTPHAATDPVNALTNNTTDDLVSDMVKLRDALGIKGKMHVFGGSWGSTLSMAYAIKHPETVETLILRGIFLCRKKDLDFLYQGNAAEIAQDPSNTDKPGTYMTFPDNWKQFVDVIPPEKRGDMVKAYADIFNMAAKTEAEKKQQTEAAIAWSVWEGSTSHRVPGPDKGKFDDPTFAKAFAQIENHYFMNGGFLGGSGEGNRENNYLLDNIHKAKDIPIYIVHGRYDQVCPLFQAEELMAKLKEVGTKYPVDYRVTDSGHSMTDYFNCMNLTEIMQTLPPMQKTAGTAKKPGIKP